MLSKVLAGMLAAAVAVSGFLYWRNDNLRAEATRLLQERGALEARVATKDAALAAAQNAARVMSEQRERALARAAEADALRAAIMEGNQDALEDVGGSLGAALRVLRGGQCACDPGGAGGAPGAAGVPDGGE